MTENTIQKRAVFNHQACEITTVELDVVEFTILNDGIKKTTLVEPAVGYRVEHETRANELSLGEAAMENCVVFEIASREVNMLGLKAVKLTLDHVTAVRDSMVCDFPL